MSHPTDLCPHTLRYVADMIDGELRPGEAKQKDALSKGWVKLAVGWRWRNYILRSFRFRLRNIATRAERKKEITVGDDCEASQ